jgi:hypothetical protein
MTPATITPYIIDRIIWITRPAPPAVTSEVAGSSADAPTPIAPIMRSGMKNAPPPLSTAAMIISNIANTMPARTPPMTPTRTHVEVPVLCAAIAVLAI